MPFKAIMKVSFRCHCTSRRADRESRREKYNGKQARALANNSIERHDGNNVNDNVLAKFSCFVHFRVVASPSDGKLAFHMLSILSSPHKIDVELFPLTTKKYERKKEKEKTHNNNALNGWCGHFG